MPLHGGPRAFEDADVGLWTPWPPNELGDEEDLRLERSARRVADARGHDGWARASPTRAPPKPKPPRLRCLKRTCSRWLRTTRITRRTGARGGGDADGAALNAARGRRGNVVGLSATLARMVTWRRRIRSRRSVRALRTSGRPPEPRRPRRHRRARRRRGGASWRSRGRRSGVGM